MTAEILTHPAWNGKAEDMTLANAIHQFYRAAEFLARHADADEMSRIMLGLGDRTIHAHRAFDEVREMTMQVQSRMEAAMRANTYTVA